MQGFENHLGFTVSSSKLQIVEIIQNEDQFVLENVDEVLATGVKSVAVTAAVVGCDDVRTAACEMKKRINHGGTEVREKN